MDERDDNRRPQPIAPLPSRIAKVIKGDASVDVPMGDKPLLRAPHRGGVVNAEEFDARSTAKGIIADAEAKALGIVADAEKKRDEVFAKATEDAKAEVNARFSEELARARMQAGQMIAGAEKEILELALSVATKIIGRDLERERDVLLEIVANAITQARMAKAMIVRVNPKDAATLREKRSKLMELVGRQVDLAVRDDADVEPGGCIIQTEFGTIDGQLKTQYEMLRNVLYPESGKKEVK
jgi:type III secretion protein L